MKGSAWVIGLVVATACSARAAPQEAWRPLDDRAENALADRALVGGERKVLDQHGFVILGSGQVRSFHTGYLAVFHEHQPVYVTADALLYAWHSSYDAILIELEKTRLRPMLDGMLVALRGALANDHSDPVHRADVDLYLAVAYSLLHDKLEPPVAGGDPRVLDRLVQQAHNASGIELTLFGARFGFDWSMLTPRGHYEDDPNLASYFRAMSWLGRLELRIAHFDTGEQWRVDRRVLNDVRLLSSLFDAGSRKTWDAFDRTLGSLVGPGDSMSLPGLAAAQAVLPADLRDASDDAIVAAFRGPAAQRIQTQLTSPRRSNLAFVLFGQRYVFDSHVLSNLVHGTLATKPIRMMPSPLDVGYGVFGNPAAKRLLTSELLTYGTPYANALEAARTSASAGDPALWNGSLHHLWLTALRMLSPDPARDTALPAPLDSNAWSRRMLATQLASWAELRHDNILYAKQSVTGATCEYPDGYVDPYPAFYAAMEAIAAKGKAMLVMLASELDANAAADAKQQPDLAADGDAADQAGTNRWATTSSRLATYFDAMAATMGRLRHIAERERANQPLEPDDLIFLNHMVAVRSVPSGCTEVLAASGWYGDLFFDPKHALVHDPVIADVHTQPTDRAGHLVGRVLHVATGLPRMIVVTIAHDGGKHSQTYRGIVSAYHQLVTNGFQRSTDAEWLQQLSTPGRPPGTPDWVDDLVAR